MEGSKNNSADLLPEQKAREKIDKWLEEVGWTVVSREEYTDAINAQAVKENLMIGNLEADYMLFLNGKAIAVLEAKRAENQLGDDVKAQAENYTRILPQTNQYWFNPIPFVFISNGETMLFKDMRDPESEYINLGKMYSPKEVCERAGIKDEFAMLPAVPPVAENKLRQCQHDAITNVELSFKRGMNRCLLDLATGSGKTFTACMLSYRAISYTPVERILYLVDRNNLGKQTEDGFKSFKLTESGQPFTSIYSVLRLKKAEEAKNTNVCISTIQRLFAVLTGQNFTDSDDDADDQNEDETFFNEEDEEGSAVELGDDVKLPKDFFQLIIVDECHRSIYGRWRKVIEYFDKAKVIGLTATPTPQAYAFFGCQQITTDKYKPTFQYSVDESYVAGINVPPRIYRIKTEVSENGGEIKDKEKIYEVNKRTGEKNSVVQEQTKNYTKTDVDRSVVNPTQIKKIVEEYRDIIYDKLFPDREPVWEYIPKTLFFAKTDKHADLIISIIKEVFKEKFDREIVPENFVQKITCTAGDTEQLIKDFRREKDFRIAVTVTLVATGTDVKPLEVLVFMRDIHSSVLYTQMKGRGCRKIEDDALKLVTPNADTKENFILVDAVGVTESEKKIPKATEGGDGTGGKKLSLEKVLEWLSHGDVSDENLQFLGEKLAFINKKTETKHQVEFEKLTGISMENLSIKIFKEMEKGLPEFEDINQPNNERKNLVSALIDKPDARKRLLNLEAGFYKILRPGKDTITYSGFSLTDSENYTKQFEEYVNLHCDEIEALKIIYNDEEKAISYAMLQDLKDKIITLNPLFQEFGVIWDAYHTLSLNNKISKKVSKLEEKEERRTLTNLIQLVRFAYGKTETLQAINGIIAKRFNLYIGQHLGTVKRDFSESQIEVLKQLADYVTQKGCFTRQELFTENRPLCMEAIKIYTPQKIDEEIDYFSKFLLQLKAA